MLKALSPMIVKSEGGGDRAMMLKASMLGSKVSFFLLMIFYIPIIIEMPYVFNLWLKNVPEYSIVFCRLLLIKNLIEQLFLTLNTSISAVGNIKKFQLYTSILNILPLFICYLLFANDLPPYTLYIVFICQAMLLAAVTLYFCKKQCDLSIPYFIKDVVVRCITSFLVVFGVVFATSLSIDNDNLRFISVLGVSAISFLIVVWLVGFNALERKNNQAFIKDIITRFQLMRSNA
jgi:hypothetical protein